MSDRIDERELARLLEATGRAHHRAFEASDGVDPDWAIWYAGHLQALVGDRLGSIPSRSELTFLLVGAERAFVVGGNEQGGWPASYARHILDHYRGS